jgi:uncharacterized protein DUF4232
MIIVPAVRVLGGVVALTVLGGLAGCGSEQAAGRPEPTRASPSGAVPPSVSPSSTPPVPCRSGVRLAAGPADAAMGLRAQVVILTNCGKRVRQVNGYPQVSLRDKDGDRITVDIDRGARRITSGVRDPGPRTLNVRPGRSVRFSLVWRNTYDDTSRPPVVGTAAIVTLGPGLRRAVHVNLDLGSTGRLGVTAWELVPGRG